MGAPLHFHMALAIILELSFFYMIRREIIENKHPTTRWISIGIISWIYITTTTSLVIINTKNIIFICSFIYLGVWIVIMNSVNQRLFVLKGLPSPSSQQQQRRRRGGGEEEEEGRQQENTRRTFSVDNPPSYIELFPISTNSSK